MMKNLNENNTQNRLKELIRQVKNTREEMIIAGDNYMLNKKIPWDMIQHRNNYELMRLRKREVLDAIIRDIIGGVKRISSDEIKMTILRDIHLLSAHMVEGRIFLSIKNRPIMEVYNITILLGIIMKQIERMALVVAGDEKTNDIIDQTKYRVFMNMVSQMEHKYTYQVCIKGAQLWLSIDKVQDSLQMNSMSSILGVNMEGMVTEIVDKSMSSFIGWLAKTK